MSTWPRVPISKVYLGLFDGPHATPKPSKKGPVFLGIGNITEDGHLDVSEVKHIAEEDFPAWTKRVTPRAGDIVFTYEATLNRYAIIPKGFRGCLGRRLALIRPNPAVVDTRWLHYYFFGADWRNTISANILAGATVERIPLTKFPDFPINLPHIGVQRRIASILSAYDDLIENNTRRVAILEEIARRLYEEWFVRFRFQGHEQVRMVESELGLIPDGWEVATVGECAIVHRGKSYKSSELSEDGGLPFVNLKCMERDGGFRKSGLKRFIGAYKETQKVTVGDLVMAVTDMTQERRIIARCGRIPRLDAGFGVISMDLVKLEPRPSVPRDYLYGMLRWSGFADEVKQHANGANVLHLLPDRISDYQFAKPDKALMDRFAATIAPMLKQVDVFGEKNTNLRTQRDLLLPKLISGEIDVSAFPEAEAVAA